MNYEAEIKSLRSKYQKLNRLVMGIRKTGGGANHNLLSSTHLDALAANVSSGDIIIGNNTPKWARLGKDSDGKILTLASGLPSWADPAAAEGEAKFEDNFADASIYWGWTTFNTGAGKTIAEASGVLNIAVTSTTNARWDASYYYAPCIHIGVIGFPFVFEVKINSYTVNDDTGAGIFYHARTGANYTYLFERNRNDGSSINGLRAERLGTQLTYNSVTTLPIWLRLKSGGYSRLRSTQYFDYSENGTTWNNLTSDSNSGFFPSTYGATVGLFVRNETPYNAIDVDFEYVIYRIDKGPE